jgi:hypothetical protein
MIKTITDAFIRSMRPTLKVSMLMLKIFVPLSVVTLVLKQLGVLELIAPFFSPFMSVIGLPGEAALTLLVGFTNTIYAALATAAVMDLTARQITILGVVLGISHSLFIETGILSNLRMATVGIAAFRMVVGLGSGIILDAILPEIGGAVVLHAVAGSFSWPDALLQIVITSLFIVGLIFSITFGYELLAEWRGADRFKPVARFLTACAGISGKAMAPWLLGVIVGITYGAALLYQFNEKEGLSHKDACLITVFLCLAHAMIEDTLLFAVMGGDFAWIFVTRMVIAVLLVRLLATDDIYKKFLWIGLPAERPKA